MQPSQIVRTACLFVLVGATAAGAQSPASGRPEPSSATPFEILDNSFLVEEAFNQEAGIFQNIFGLIRIGGGWEMVFTQEWPVGGQTHQFSYGVPVVGASDGRGPGDVLINYRWQASTEAGGRPAFSPRISLILPTGDTDRGRGSGTVGLQTNLPFSRQVGDFYVHWNAGLTWLPGVEASLIGEDVTLTSPHLGASAIWRARPLIHLMLESIVLWEQSALADGTTTRERAATLSPGVRAGWNFGDQQLVLGLAVPVTFSGGESDTGIFGYASYELPFR